MKTTLLISCFLVLSATSYAQQLFETILSTDSKYNIVNPNGSSARTKDGGFILIGQTSFYSNIVQYKVHIHKFDKNGKPQWSKFYQATNYVVYSTIIQTTDGGYAIAGLLNVAKLDSLGNLSWSKSYTNYAYLSYAHTNINAKLVNAADGSLILGGSGDGGPNFSGRLYILNLNNKTGSVIAFRIFTSLTGYHEQFGNIYRTSDNGYLLCGTNWDIKNNFSLPIMLILKVSANFTPEWQKVIKGRYYTDYSIDYATDAVETSDGGYVICGYSQSSYDSLTRLRSFDACVIKLDHNGNQVWKKQIGNRLNDIAYAITKTSDSAFIIAGSYNDITAYHTNALILKVSNKGALNWVKTQGGTDGNYFSSLIKSNDNTITASGTSYSFGTDNGSFLISKFTTDGNGCDNNITPAMQFKDYPDTIYNAPAYSDTVLNTTVANFPLQPVTLKVNRNIVCKSTLPMNKQQTESRDLIVTDASFSVSVFPNPVSSGILNINLNNEALHSMELVIYDALGNRVFIQNVASTKNQTVNIAHLPSGFYLLKVVCGNKQTTARFIKS